MMIFNDFASDELKNDKYYAMVILGLDGFYINCMGEKIKSSESLMSLAIENDSSYDVSSFTMSDSILSSDSKMALLYLKKLRNNINNDSFVEEVYKNIFAIENGEFSKSIFKHNEQSNWFSDSCFLSSLERIDENFTPYIDDGRISPKLIIKK